MGKRFVKDIQLGDFTFGILDRLKLVFIQLLFSHYLLDYLTTYGVMLNYPFSFERFKFPLMFIVDPFFWVFSGWFVLTSLRRGVFSRKRSMYFLIVVLTYWAACFQMKNMASNLSNKVSYYRSVDVSSPLHVLPKSQVFPGFLAPFFWQWAVYSEGLSGFGSVSFFRNPAKYTYERFDQQTYSVDLCEGFNWDSIAKDLFDRYSRFAELPICHAHKLGSEQGCRCVSLKYGSALWEQVPFGSFFFSKKGEHRFLKPKDTDALIRFLNKQY